MKGRRAICNLRVRDDSRLRGRRHDIHVSLTVASRRSSVSNVRRAFWGRETKGRQLVRHYLRLRSSKPAAWLCEGVIREQRSSPLRSARASRRRDFTVSVRLSGPEVVPFRFLTQPCPPDNMHRPQLIQGATSHVSHNVASKASRRNGHARKSPLRGIMRHRREAHRGVRDATGPTHRHLQRFER